MEVKQSIDEIPCSDMRVEAGDLSNEFGKIYTKRLEEAFNDNSKFKKDKLYFITFLKRDPRNYSNMELSILVLPNKPSGMYEGADLWEYDYVQCKADLHWSVPHRCEMKNFLNDPLKYSKKSIEWIKMYLKQENLDLNKLKTQVILS